MHTSSSPSILHQSPHVADASLLPAIQNQTMASPSSSSASNSTSLGQSPGVSLLDFLRPAMSEIEQPGRTEASPNPIEIEIVDASSTTAYSSCFTSTTCSTQSAIEPVSGSSVSGAPSMASPASTTSRSVEECCGRPTIPLDQVDKLISISELASQVASVALGEAIDPSAQGEDGSLAELATLEWVATVSQSLQSELQTVFANLNRPQPPQQTATDSAEEGSLAPSELAGSSETVVADRHTQEDNKSEGEGAKGSRRRRRKQNKKDLFKNIERKCTSCGRTETPKWRNGPLGAHTLCNTCGLAFGRKKRKKEQELKKQKERDKTNDQQKEKEEKEKVSEESRSGSGDGARE